MTGIPYEELVHQRDAPSPYDFVTVLRSANPPPRRADPEDAPDDDVGGEEQQDDGLDDVDDLDRDLGLDLHQPGPARRAPNSRAARRSRTGGLARAGPR